MSHEKPTFVIAPGSFHVVAHMEPLVKALLARGYPSSVIQSPEIGVVGKTEILAELEKSIRDKLHEHIECEGKNVVLVCCSAGGSRGSMAVRGFERSSRAQKGQCGGIIYVAFVAAILVPDGETVISTIGGKLPEWMTIDKERNMQVPSPICGEIFYNDMDKESQQLWASKLEPMSIRNHPLPVQGSCWDVDVPKAYVRTRHDCAVTLEAQDRMIERVRKGHEAQWTVVTMDSGHSPFLSRTEELCKVLEEITGAAKT